MLTALASRRFCCHLVAATSASITSGFERRRIGRRNSRFTSSRNVRSWALARDDANTSAISSSHAPNRKQNINLKCNTAPRLSHTLRMSAGRTPSLNLAFRQETVAAGDKCEDLSTKDSAPRFCTIQKQTLSRTVLKSKCSREHSQCGHAQHRQSVRRHPQGYARPVPEARCLNHTLSCCFLLLSTSPLFRVKLYLR